MRDVTWSHGGAARPGVGEQPRAERRRELPFPWAGTVLAVAVLPACPRAVPRLRRLTRAVVRSRRLPKAAEEALSVVVSELASNVVLHSGSPDLTVSFAADAYALTVGVRDRGRWRERPSPRREAADMDAEFGRGLALVDAYAVDRAVVCTAQGTLVRAVIAL